MKNYRDCSFPFTCLALAGLLAFSVSTAQAQTFTLQNNQLQITGGSGTTFSSQTQTISNLGVVGTFIDVPSTNGVGIPSFNFTLVPNGVPDGSYNFRVGVTIDDDANNRRMEAKIETLTLTVSGTTVTGTIPVASNPNGLRVLGRDGGNTLQVTLDVPNNQQSGPITVSGGTVSFNASTLIDRIRSSTTTAFDTYILKEFDQPAAYTYRIAVQQTSNLGNPLNFGTTQPAFTALPKVGVDVTSNAAFELQTNNLASGFTSAPTVTGKFNVVFISSGGGGGTTTTTVPATTSGVSNAANEIVVPTTGPVDAAVVTAANNVVTATNTLLTNALATAGTANKDTVFSALDAANTALSKAGDVKSVSGGSGSGVSSSATTSVVTNVADIVSALSKSTTPLTTEQKDQVATIVTSTVTNATKLITTETPRSEILSLVEATSKLLQSSNDATGAIKAALVTQLQALSTKATQTILPTLPESIRGTGNLNSIDAIRTLASAKATVTEVVQKSAPESCGRPNIAFLHLSPQTYYEQKSSFDTCLARGGVASGSGDGSSPTVKLAEGLNLFAATSSEQPVFVTGESNLVQYSSKNYAASATSERVMPGILNDGLYGLPDGRTLYVSGSRGIDISGNALNSVAFANAITNANFTPSFNNNGSFRINLGNNEHFAGAFALTEIGSASTTCDSVTINSPTGNPASTDYAFTMVCSGGVTQKITPFPHSTVFFDTVTNAGFDVRTNRNTGVISIEGVGDVRPSFFVMPLSLSDTTYLNANKTAEGIAVRAADTNGDGKTDYEILSADGVQVLYGL